MDAVVVEVAVAATADCSDRARSELELKAALRAARAPRRTERGAGWTLQVDVASVAPGIKSADARIVDDAGAVVAERSLSDKTTGSCLALARGVGAWAQIVLDDELVRAHDAPPEPSVAPSIAPAPLGTPAPPIDADAPTTGVVAAAPRSPRGTEVGALLFLRNGIAPGGAFGVAPFAAFRFAEVWVLRPAAAVATSVAWDSDERRPAATSLGGRLDFCRRIQGNYIIERGLELDLCGGSDLNWVTSRGIERVRSSAGPSAIMRGGLGDLALELRSMAGVNLTRADGLEPFVLSCEVGASVRFQ